MLTGKCSFDKTLHFLPGRDKFLAPQPLLLAAMLYSSSMRSSIEYAHLAPQYLNIFCNAIAQLNVPGSEIGMPLSNPAAAEEYAFQTVMGLLLAALLNEGNVRETGLWISMAYRLTLEHCPPQVDERDCDWRKLFKGVQILDLEHASLHLVSPLVPIEPPLAALQTPSRDQLYRLSQMMHTGLSRFAGRSLPTIWSCFASNPSDAVSAADPFTPVDAAVIRDWARHLDDWLVEFAKAGDDSDHQRKVVFRQYVLHRLVVLSIYHPAKTRNLRSSSSTIKEQHELLISARATLKLHLNDKLIWSNWDLVLITWAALIVIQGIEVGGEEADGKPQPTNDGQPSGILLTSRFTDLRNIRIHLDMLRETNEPLPNLRDKLATRLEYNLQTLHTPSPTAVNHHMTMAAMSPEANMEYQWNIFDQTVMNQIMDPFWLRAAEMQAADMQAAEMQPNMG